MSASRSEASAIARSIAPASSGFGKATVGKSGSGSSCWDTTCGRGEPGGLQHLQHRRPADAVQRRVDDVEVAGAVRRPGPRRCRSSGRRSPRRAPCPGLRRAMDVDRPRRRRSARRSRVGRRHDLAAVAEVDLVAVVLGRVVAGGHHHAGDAPELADRERQHRRRQRPRHQQRLEARARSSPRRCRWRRRRSCSGRRTRSRRGCRRASRCRGGTPPGRPRRAARRRGSSGWAAHRARRADRRCRTRASRRTGPRGRPDRPPPSTSAMIASSSARVCVVGVVLGPGAGPGEQSVVHAAHRTVPYARRQP